MNDDPKAARRAAADELRQCLRVMGGAGIPAELVFYDAEVDLPGHGGGEGMFIPISIGSRGNLSKAQAERGAAMWRAATRSYPHACFMINLLGYNDDPREVWEFHDARRYVRWWARFAGMNDLATADHWLGPGSAVGTLPTPLATSGMSFLAACGVFGEELRQAALCGHQPMVPQ